MLVIHSSEIDLYPGSQEERLPGFTPQFPHICSYVPLQLPPAGYCNWHWHRSFELFYVDRGSLLYHTPGGTRKFRAGSGGMVNSNVLHRTQCLEEGTVQRLHLFEPELLSGIPGGLVEQRYIAPLLAPGAPELLALSTDDPAQGRALDLLQQSLALDETAYGYELELQALLSQIWVQLLRQLEQPSPAVPCQTDTDTQKVKKMMLFIHAHYAEKLTVPAIAAAAYCSERECYRGFQACLHQTPADYLQNIRLQAACKQLMETDVSITAIAQNCGLGSSSYFGAQFRRVFGCTPTQYRQKWQDPDIDRHKSDSTSSSEGSIMMP